MEVSAAWQGRRAELLMRAGKYYLSNMEEMSSQRDRESHEHELRRPFLASLLPCLRS